MQLVRYRTAQILAIEGILMRQTGARMKGEAVKRLTAEQVDAFAFAPDVSLAVEANRAVSQVLSQQIEALEKRLKQKVLLRPEYRLLKTVPGIGDVLATTIMLETGTISRFTQEGNFSSYCRCVDSLKESNGKRKGEGNTRNGNKYLAWAFVEAANFALRCCPQAKSFYDRKKSRSNRILALKGARAQAGAGLLPHSARPEALRCAPVFRVTVWPRAVSQESGLARSQANDLDIAFAPS
jgi:transposase